MPDPDRILLIRPSALGDVCRSVPVLASLRRAWPEATIDWLVRDSFADAVRAHPDLSGVLTFPRAALGRSMRRANPAPSLRWLRELRRGRYDLAIDAQGLARSGLFAWATRASRRVGYANAREGAPIAYTERLRVDRDMHAVDRMLALVEAMGVVPVADMRLYPPESDRAAVDADERLAGPGLIVLAPTSAWPAKRWPGKRFVALAEALLERAAARIAIVGAPGEEDQCRGLRALATRRDRVVDLVGATSVGRLMAVIERADLVVANDSAALHMAVGLDRPIVALFGPTRTALVGPYRRDDDVVQHVRPGEPLDHKSAASRAMMERITVDEVLERALARLDAPRPSPISRSSPRSPA